MKPFVVVTLLTMMPIVQGGAQTSRRQCPAGPYFEFQVDQPARPLADSVAGPRLSNEAALANVVQFMVDTAGRVEPGSFKVLRVADTALVRELRDQLPQRRFAPARVGPCVVRQLIQTGVVRAPAAPAWRRSGNGA